MKEHFKPTESELEILQIVWKQEPVSVRFVNDELNKKRNVGYTTTLKIMQIMTDKGMLRREGQGRKHLYYSVVRQQEIQKTLLDKFLKTTFEGSAMNLVMQALGNHKTSPEELDKIRALIDEIENEGGEL